MNNISQKKFFKTIWKSEKIAINIKYLIKLSMNILVTKLISINNI